MVSLLDTGSSSPVSGILSTRKRGEGEMLRRVGRVKYSLSHAIFNIETGVRR